MDRATVHRKKHHKLRKFFQILAGSVGLFVLFLILYSVTTVSQAPKIDPDNIYANLSESSILYDADDKIIENIYQGDGNRVNISYDQIPKDLVNAVVAIEDKTFWEHNGFNIVRMFGAIGESLRSHRISGTSTITQQLARNVYLPETKSVRSLNRKICEAWYTIQLEHELSKEQILEAYLNTIYFGYNSYGIQAASQAYFSRDVEKLNLAQCVALAAIPSSPEHYALVQAIDNQTVESEALELKKKNILHRSSDGYTVVFNGDASQSRRDQTIANMEEQGYITSSEADKVKKNNLKKELDLDDNVYRSKSSYYADYVIGEVIDDLIQAGYTSSDARKMLYTGGLRIHTSLDQKVQKAIDDAFSNDSNFPSIEEIARDENGNIVNDDGGVMLYRYGNFFNDKKQLVISKGEYKKKDNGDLILKTNGKLKFYDTETNGDHDVRVEIRSMYKEKDGLLYSIESSVLLIPQGYKSKDSDGNLVVSHRFMEDYPDFFQKKGKKYLVGEEGYSLGQEVKQPQGAIAVVDYKTGALSGIAGGREVSGKFLYNRANRPRQPGSAIKPLSVYSTALEQGVESARAGRKMSFKKRDNNDILSLYGNYWTANSKINDAPMTFEGRVWPQNVYNGYKGPMTMRRAIEQSSNVCAVRTLLQVGVDNAISQLRKFGVTSVEEKDNTNDKNAAALALGGMAKGISPVEMASAYGAFANEGDRIQCKAYTKVTDKDGATILKNEKKKEKVMSSGVAFVMSDILRTTVARGTAKDAKGTIPVAGKTGTTSDKYDLWFCGFTPQYSAACWIGSDVNLRLSDSSPAAVRLWKTVLTAVATDKKGKLPEKPSSVIRFSGEYYVDGTQRAPTTYTFDDDDDTDTEETPSITTTVEVCAASGYLATPWCHERVEKNLDGDDEHGSYYCPYHNEDPSSYDIPPGYSVTVTEEEW